MKNRLLNPNATAIYSDKFSTSAIREVWSDRSRTDGLVNTVAIMMALGPKMGRGEAHDRLAAISLTVSRGKGRLIDLLSNDAEIGQILDCSAIERLIEPSNYLGNSGAMVDRVLVGRRD